MKAHIIRVDDTSIRCRVSRTVFVGKKENVFVGMVSGWRRYMSHPMFFASFGYVL